MTTYARDGLPRLLGAQTYREFIRYALEALYPENDGWGAFSKLAKAAGFASRSTPRDIIRGRKRITASSIQGITVGLGLKGDLKEYFRWLVMREEEKLNREGRSSEQIEERLKKLRERLQRRTKSPEPAHAEPFLRSRDGFVVFACLGSAETGASLFQISGRCRLSLSRIRAAIDHLTDSGLVRHNERRWYPVVTHMDFDAQGAVKSFEDLYRGSLEETSRRLLRHPEKTSLRDRLYFDSLISVDRGRLEEFRTSLRSLCLQFVEKAQEPEGDGLAKLLVAFEPYDS